MSARSPGIPTVALTLSRGFFGRGDMQEDFEKKAFALKKGEVSGAVETASGVHLIQRWDDLGMPHDDANNTQHRLE